jgi:DNA-directed RNA polymerase subunit RPC12/RpoP
MSGRGREGYTRFTEEEELDSTLEAEASRKRLRKNAVLFYLICVVMIPVLMFIFLVIGGFGTDPLYLPAWAILFAPIIMAIVAIIGHMIITVKRSRVVIDDHEAKFIMRSSMSKVALAMTIGIVFMVLFGSLLPFSSPNWLEDYMDKNHGTYDQVVSENYAKDFKFQGNDVYGFTHLSVEVKIPSNATPVDVYIGEFDKIRGVENDDNWTEVREACLPNAFSTHIRNYTYEGEDFEEGKVYALRIYNYNSSVEVTATIILHRKIDEGMIYGLFALMLVVVGIAVPWIVFVAVRKKASARARARPARAPAGRAASAKDVIKGMEEEMDEIFMEKGAAPRPREGMPPPPARPAARRAPEPARRPAAEPVLERPVGEKRSIKCPKCAKRFSYIKKEGVFEIRCPNCGKRGRVGKPKAAPRTEPGPPKRVEPARAPARPAAPARATAGPPAAKKKTIGCPKCKKRFQIEEKPRPFKIECPHCGKTGMLK